MITESEIKSLQAAWGEGIVAIGKAYDAGGDYQALAVEFVQNLYGYDHGEVFFKPTLASAQPFRFNFEEALSYFVTGCVPEDRGFALRGLKRIRFDDTIIKIHCAKDYAFSMGHYYGTERNGSEIKIEFSFVYIKDSDGNLKIKLHHSSLPYLPYSPRQL